MTGRSASIALVGLSVWLVVFLFDKSDSTLLVFPIVALLVVRDAGRIHYMSRYVSAATLAIAAGIVYLRIETPFPFFLEFWADMPLDQTMNVILMIGLGATVMTLLQGPNSKTPISH